MALGLGSTNPLPFTLGGGDSTVQIEHQAILDALEPGFDISNTTALYAEAYAEAIAVAMIWYSNARLSNQMIPERMLENLTVWEKSCTLRPSPDEPDRDRRSRLSAKLRGVAANAIGDIEEAAITILGANFDQLSQTSPANHVAYWPGVNPGPPGYEWSSNRASISISINSNNLDKNSQASLVSAMILQLDAMCPSWMSFRVGVGLAFICNQGIVGQTIL